MKSIARINEIGMKIKEWRIKQDKRENSLKYMKETRKRSLVGFFISLFLLPIFLKVLMIKETSQNEIIYPL